MEQKNRQQPTSIKEMLQGMQTASTALITGTVTSETPLLIQANNDSKLILNENVLIIPWHLTDYETGADFQLASGQLDSVTFTDGEHSGHDGGTGAHSNRLQTYELFNGKITVYNHLRVGDVVRILAVANLKRYYVLDRIEGLDIYGGSSGGNGISAVIDAINGEVV